MGQIVKARDVMGLLKAPETKARLQAALANVGVTPERMVSWSLTAIRRQPQLAKCDPMSLLGAVIQSAQLGLDPSGVTGEAYLVPFKSEVTLIPGYRGLIALARRSGKVSEIMGNVVREGDEFDYEYGLNSKLRHKPVNPDGEITHIYAYAKMSDGASQFVVLTKGEVDKVRDQSRASRNGPWVQHYEAMAVKTAVRRLAKWLPLKPDEYRGFEMAEREEMGTPEVVKLDDIEVSDHNPDIPGESEDDDIPGEQGAMDFDPETPSY